MSWARVSTLWAKALPKPGSYFGRHIRSKSNPPPQMAREWGTRKALRDLKPRWGREWRWHRGVGGYATQVWSGRLRASARC